MCFDPSSLLNKLSLTRASQPLYSTTPALKQTSPSRPRDHNMIPIRQVAPRADVGYTKLSQIGEGGFGKVYNARRNADGTVFALKEMKPRDNVTQSEMRADLRKELDCIQRVQPHHHIIQAYDAFEKGPEFSLIVFPAANGGHLQRYLQNIPRAGATSPGTIDVVEKAFGCLAHGLAHMHVRHLRHKDIKPGNILLHGGRVICKP